MQALEQDALVDALGKHLDAAASLVNWSLGLVFLTLWAGLRRDEEIAVLSLKVSRVEAFFLLGAALIYVNIDCILLFLRIKSLLHLVDARHIAKALTIIGTNAWPFNPFTNLGSIDGAPLLGAAGYGGLVAIWWIGYSALSLCRDDWKSPGFLLMVGIYLLIGTVSSQVIELVFLEIMRRSTEVSPDFAASIVAQIGPRFWAGNGATGFGMAVFLFARLHANKVAKRGAHGGALRLNGDNERNGSGEDG